VRGRLLSSVDEGAALSSLRGRGLNYDPAGAPQDGRPDGHWHVDGSDIVLGREAAGAPAAGGPWELACALVAQYEFTDGRIVRAIYRPADDLLGRDMLLEGRFAWLRFYLGVRVTGVTDETRDGGRGAERVWGWSYQTLQGHLEQGRLSYEVIKNLASGRVTFRVCGYSRPAPMRSPVIRLGFALFGRRTQRRFYRSVQLRLRALVQAGQRGAPLPRPAVRADGIAIAPAGAAPDRLDRLARGTLHPGR
jgi:uncharacterized protein (UPF0548 family)